MSILSPDSYFVLSPATNPSTFPALDVLETPFNDLNIGPLV